MAIADADGTVAVGGADNPLVRLVPATQPRRPRRHAGLGEAARALLAGLHRTTETHRVVAAALNELQS